jgi:hypothetical protein
MEQTIEKKIKYIKSRIKLNEVYLDFEKIYENKDQIEKLEKEKADLKNELRSIILENLIEK